MKESLHLEIQAEYEAQRAANWAEEARRLAEASAADPMIGTLVAERMEAFQSQARTALANPKAAGDIARALTRKITDIQAQLRDRLAASGFPQDYLQPVYGCARCHDTGHVGDTLLERCDCYAQRLRARVAGEKGHGVDMRETFEAYDERVYSSLPLQGGKPGESHRSLMARMRAYCEEYVARFPNNPEKNLLLFGGSGLGKTYLLNCVGNRLRGQGVEVLKITAYQLSERMRAAIFERRGEAFSVLLDVQVLMLDDLGVEPLINNVTIEQLFTLLNERTLKGLPTLVSTNLQLGELRERYTERVFSRLLDRRNTATLRLLGQDVRLQ